MGEAFLKTSKHDGIDLNQLDEPEADVAPKASKTLLWARWGTRC